MLYYQNTSFEIKATQPHSAVLPIAAVEQHGPHLPVGADWIIMDAIARRVTEALGDGHYLLPTMPFGTSANHGGTPGTVWLSPTTLMHVVRDLVESLLFVGIRRVVVINQHGGAGETSVIPRGNYIVKTAVRQLNYDHPELTVIWVQPFTAGKEEILRLLPSARDDVHAGSLETSVLLAIAEDRVKGRGVDSVPGLGKEYMDYLPFSTISPSGVWGRPSTASGSLGEAVLEAAVQGTVRYIQASFSHLAEIRPGSANSSIPTFDER